MNNSTTEVIQDLAILIQRFCFETPDPSLRTLENFASWSVRRDTNTNPHRYAVQKAYNEEQILLNDNHDDNGPES